MNTYISFSVKNYLVTLREFLQGVGILCKILVVFLQFADDKTTWKILQQARQQQEELQAEYGLTWYLCTHIAPVHTEYSLLVFVSYLCTVATLSVLP